MEVNIVLAPRMAQPDVTGPFEVLSRAPGWTISLVAATTDPVRTEKALRIVPDVTRENAAAADLLVIPGGTGVDFARLDPQWISFVERRRSMSLASARDRCCWALRACCSAVSRRHVVHLAA